MTLTSAFAADVFRRRINAFTGRADGNGLAAEELPRDGGSSILVARPGGFNRPNLRETDVQLLRRSVRDLGAVTADITNFRVDRATTCMGPDGPPTGPGNMFACTGIRRARYTRNDFRAVYLDQGIR